MVMQLPEWFNDLILWLEWLSLTLPIPWFVVIGAALEEVFPPIPSSAVFFAAGSLVAAQGGSLGQILVLAVLAGVVKTVFAILFYFLADKIEDRLPPRLLRFLGYERGQIEQYGRKFSQGWKDAVILLTLRAIPLISSLPVSIVCGFLKTDLRTYVWTSMLGFTIKSFGLIYIGYVGLEVMQLWQ